VFAGFAVIGELLTSRTGCTECCGCWSGGVVTENHLPLREGERIVVGLEVDDIARLSRWWCVCTVMGQPSYLANRAIVGVREVPAYRSSGVLAPRCTEDPFVCVVSRAKESLKGDRQGNLEIVLTPEAPRLGEEKKPLDGRFASGDLLVHFKLLRISELFRGQV
jgi:hypothetical protein